MAPRRLCSLRTEPDPPLNISAKRARPVDDEEKESSTLTTQV